MVTELVLIQGGFWWWMIGLLCSASGGMNLEVRSFANLAQLFLRFLGGTASAKATARGCSAGRRLASSLDLRVVLLIRVS